MILYGTLLIAATLIGGLVYRYDMFDREPWFMVLLAAAAGVAVMYPMGTIEEAALFAIWDHDWPDWGRALIAGTFEETARLLVVAMIALLIPAFFNDPMDGIIYGSIVGLGMAIEESIYFMNLEETLADKLPPSEVIRLTGHLLMGGITCFGVGMVRMKLPRAWTILVACAGTSMLLHMAWDSIAFAAREVGVMAWWQTTLAVALMIFGMLLYGMLVTISWDWSKRHFEPHSLKELWGWPIVRGKATNRRSDEATKSGR